MTDARKSERAAEELIDQLVLIDTDGPTIVMGRLTRVASDCYVLDDADVHDRDEGHSGKELYVLNALKIGLRVNRRRVYIPRRHVIAISALDDVVIE